MYSYTIRNEQTCRVTIICCSTHKEEADILVLKQSYVSAMVLTPNLIEK